MIKLRFAELKRQKALREGRDLTLRKIASETGLAVDTVHRLNKGETGRVYLTTLDALCDYFDVKEVGELLEYVPNDKEFTPLAEAPE
ncbi:MAG: helix-turn-helix domain-containing protein [Janthinobacterium lividum]